jgi:hypothetical protein
MRASQNHRLQHARQTKIIGVETSARNVAGTFLAADPRTDVFFVSHKSLPFIYRVKAQAKQNPKSEYRNPKTNPKSELHPRPKRTDFEFVMFGSFENCFEFRISSFEFVRQVDLKLTA